MIEITFNGFLNGVEMESEFEVGVECVFEGGIYSKGGERQPPRLFNDAPYLCPADNEHCVHINLYASAYIMPYTC
ncbi:hypothetical protein DHB64_07295 [Antarcticibacterium sp. W02-3]|nr:hypothetical protein [Antarcticibacterium sp. W02-3]